MPKKVRDLMTKDVVTLTADMTIIAASQKLIERNVSNAPVVNEAARLVGFVSELDFIAEYNAGRIYIYPERLVRDIMRITPIAVTADCDLHNVAAIFLQHGYRHLPVLDNKTLVGIVSRKDALHALEAARKTWEAAGSERSEVPNAEHLTPVRFMVG